VFTIFLGLLITLFIFPPQVYYFYLTTVLPSENFWIINPSNISLVGFITRILLQLGLSLNKSVLIGEMSGSILLIALFLTIILFVKKIDKQYTKTANLLIQNVIFIIGFIVFPIIWDWESIVLLLPAVLFINALKAIKPSFFLTATYSIMGVLLFISPKWTMITSNNWLQQVMNASFMVILSLGVPAFVLLVLLGVQLRLLFTQTKKFKQ